MGHMHGIVLTVHVRHWVLVCPVIFPLQNINSGLLSVSGWGPTEALALCIVWWYLELQHCMGCMLCSCDQNDIPTHFLYSSTALMKACNQKVHDSKYSVHPGQPIFHDLACMVPHMIQRVLSPLIGTYASDISCSCIIHNVACTLQWLNIMLAYLMSNGVVCVHVYLKHCWDLVVCELHLYCPASSVSMG